MEKRSVVRDEREDDGTCKAKKLHKLGYPKNLVPYGTEGLNVQQVVCKKVVNYVSVANKMHLLNLLVTTKIKIKFTLWVLTRYLECTFSQLPPFQGQGLLM